MKWSVRLSISAVLAAVSVASAAGWQKTYNSGNADDAVAVRVDKFGNVWVLGCAQGANKDVVLLKYDGNTGDPVFPPVIWRGNPDLEDNPVGLAVYDDVTGQQDVVAYVAVASNQNFWVLSYSGVGDQRWQHEYVRTGDDVPMDIAVAPGASGGCVVVGSCINTTTKMDYLVVSLRSDGSERWVATWDRGAAGDDHTDYATAVAIAADGAVYVTGTSDNSVEDDENFDFATLKLSSTNGGLLWNASIHDEWVIDEPTDIVVTSGTSGAVYVTGTADDDDEDVDVLTVSLGISNGTELAHNVYGDVDEEESAVELCTSPQGYLYVLADDDGSPGFTTLRYGSALGDPVVWRYAATSPKGLAVDYDHDGNVYVAGDVAGTSLGIAAVFYDNSGNIKKQWEVNQPQVSEAAADVAAGHTGIAPWVAVVGTTDDGGQTDIVTIRFDESVEGVGWEAMPAVPYWGSPYHDKEVRQGGCLVAAGDAGHILCAKGNNTREFWEYRADVPSWDKLEYAMVPYGTEEKYVKSGFRHASMVTTTSTR
jgi:hypothetical protein